MRWAALSILMGVLVVSATVHSFYDFSSEELDEEDIWSPEASIPEGSDLHRMVLAIRPNVERANYQPFYEWTPLTYRQFMAQDHWWLADGSHFMAKARISHFDVAHIRIFVPQGTKVACLEAYRPYGRVIGRNTDVDTSLEVLHKMDGRYGCDFYAVDWSSASASQHQRDEL